MTPRRSTPLFLYVVALTQCIASPSAGLRLLPAAKPQQFFGGGESAVLSRWTNAAASPVALDVRVRLLQANSATVAPVAEAHWKTLEILPGQTVLESAPVVFPAVRAETRFLVQWLGGVQRVLGTTDILIYPTNLIEELKPLMGDEPLGLFDPLDQLKPLARAVALDFLDLEATGLEQFRGNLAIVGPFASASQMPARLAKQIQAAARAGAGVVWIQPPEPAWPRRKLTPSFYSLAEGPGQIIVAQASLVDTPAANPQSQLNLLDLARLAVRPESLCLPHQIRP